MTTTKKKKNPLVLITFITLTLTAFLTGATNTSHSQHKQNSDKKAEDNLEVIEVVGQRPASYFLKIRNTKRFAFMDAFNQHIQDKDLAFECRDIVSTGSRIPKQVCRNVFDWRIIQEISDREIRNGNITGSYSRALMGNAEHKQRRQELLSSIELMLAENNEFNTLYTEFRRADSDYQEAHIREHGDNSIYAREKIEEKPH